MPRVPTYDNFTVNPSVNPDVRVATPEFQDFSAKQGAQMAQGLMTAGTAASRIGADIQNEANLIRVDDADNKLKEAALALQYDKDNGFANVKGEAALNRASGKPMAVEYQEKLQQKIDEISQSLGNEQQRKIFGMKARDTSMRVYALATAHETQQFQEYTLSVQDGKIKNASNAIVLDPLNRENVSKNLGDINQAVYTVGKIKGMSADQIAVVQREAVSGTHLNVIKTLVEQQNADGASAYFKEFKDQFSGVQKADADKLVRGADQAKVATQTADEIWSSMGPKGYNDPVDIYKMEEQVRAKFRDDPAKAKATIDELRSRKAAFDSSQSEFVAANTNSIGKMVLSGMSLTKIQASPEFQALPGKDQAQVSQSITDRNHMLWARSIEDRNRLEADAARKNFAAYLDYTNPDKLVTMTRPQVEALWATVGREQAANLVQRWDTLQDKSARLTATMDQAQFNAIAESFELHPYDPKKNENEKAKLGLLHHQVNLVIDAEQRTRRQPLTPEEKGDIMRREMAKTVTVGGWIWDSTKPAIMLNDDEAAKVVVPTAQRQQIITAMQQRYQQTNDPAFAPTEQNIRMWYLTTVRSKK